MRTWVLTHLFRIWTALITLTGIGWSFLYKPEWLTWWLRTTMASIEKVCALLPYPWGDRVEVAGQAFTRGRARRECPCRRTRSYRGEG
jgi:hypothetical protein